MPGDDKLSPEKIKKEFPSGEIVGAEVERVPNINEAEPCSYAEAYEIQKMAREKYQVAIFVGEKNWIDAHKKDLFE